MYIVALGVRADFRWSITNSSLITSNLHRRLHERCTIFFRSLLIALLEGWHSRHNFLKKANVNIDKSTSLICVAYWPVYLYWNHDTQRNLRVGVKSLIYWCHHTNRFLIFSIFYLNTVLKQCISDYLQRPWG